MHWLPSLRIEALNTLWFVTPGPPDATRQVSATTLRPAQDHVAHQDALLGYRRERGNRPCPSSCEEDQKSRDCPGEPFQLELMYTVYDAEYDVLGLYRLGSRL